MCPPIRTFSRVSRSVISVKRLRDTSCLDTFIGLSFEIPYFMEGLNLMIVKSTDIGWILS